MEQHDQRELSRRGLFASATALAAVMVSEGRPGRAVAQALPGASRLPARTEFVVRGAYVVTMDPALGELPAADVHVRDGSIVAVGRLLNVANAEVIDGRGFIAMPGLIETHWHMWNTIARNMAGDDEQHGYFPVQLALGALFSPEDNARGVRLSLAEAISSGITTVHNWAHNLLGPGYADAEIAVHREIGIRARYSYGYSRNTKAGDTLPFADIMRIKNTWFSPGDGLTALGIASKGPETNAVDICRKEWEFARNLGLPITTHVSMYPKKHDAIKRLGDAGLLGPDVQLIHATNASAAEVAMIGATGTHVSVSPYTEMRTGFGFGPYGELLATGVPVSLSIDTTVLCGNADMFGIMRGVQNVENGRKQNEFALPAKRALQMGTIEGARDLGVAGSVGSLTPGKRADLILVRGGEIHSQPLNDVTHALVQSVQASDVDTVVIDGRFLKRHGRLTAIDVERVVREAAMTISRVRSQLGTA
jgi:cytosine/adenosine deaminase-related metal-dependent hydrolase